MEGPKWGDAWGPHPARSALMTWKQIVPAIVFMVALAVILIWVAMRAPSDGDLAQASQAQAPVEKPTVDDLFPEGEGRVRLSGSTLSETDDEGNVIGEASFAGDARVDAKTNRATAREVVLRVSFAGEQEIRLEAPSFEADLTEMQMDFPQGTRGSVSDGSGHFAANGFAYDARAGQITGTGEVSFQRQGFLLTGEKLVIDTNTKEILVTGAPARFSHAEPRAGRAPS